MRAGVMLMYEIDVIKKTKLAKKLGGPPIFHDGFLKKAVFTKERVSLFIEILSDNNPSLNKDTLVTLQLNNVYEIDFTSREHKDNLFIIHDLDIRREDDGLHLRLESARGDVSEFVFESIELCENES